MDYEWNGKYDGLPPWRVQLIKTWKYVQRWATDRRVLVAVGVLLAVIVYLLLPSEQVVKDSRGNVVENTIHQASFTRRLPTPTTVNAYGLHLRNSSITKQEFDGGLVEMNCTEDGQTVQLKNVTLSTIVGLCRHHYEHQPKANCICLQNFGLLLRGACLNNSGTVELATNIYLDRDGWSNKNSDYLVNGRPMRIAHKTRIIYWKPTSATAGVMTATKVVNTDQMQNICMIVCYEGGLS